MSHTHTLALPVLLVFLLLGCEEDVIAVRETSRPFSLFGVLSPQLDT